MTKPTLIEVTTEDELAIRLSQHAGSSDVFTTTLHTDQRVLARVTDGIYRQPGSALRELISNAYDADATEVIVQTDRPRFDQIVISDNGVGMSPAALAHVLNHIGGSAKRHRHGVDLGMARSDDPTRSPGGRKLIGKIGIGLFSVSQLTNSFDIITKTKGDPFRSVASVVLRQYTDEPVENDGEMYEAGRVNLWREPAEDIESQGTRIVLTGVRPSTKKLLRSSELWETIEQAEELSDDSPPPKPPRYHIGRVQGGGGSELRNIGEQLDATPWNATDEPVEAFSKLVDAVWEEVGRATPNPRLSEIFDAYLQMVWDLSLAVPLQYVDGHPFDIAFGDSVYAFSMPASPRNTPTKVELSGEDTARSALDLGPEVGALLSFSVLVDDLELRRPIKFRDLPTTSNVLPKPMLFVGSCSEAFEEHNEAFTGGPLEFQAYLFWNPKIAPTEHRGALVRVHESSGSLFDPTFLRYQISEQNRLRQITCEIFVTRGLDGALNIDRESFNYAHPHAIYISRWLHSALRRLASTQKRVAAELRQARRKEEREEREAERNQTVRTAWERVSDDDGSSPPPVVFVDEGDEPSPGGEGYCFPRSEVFETPDAPDGFRAKASAQAEQRLAAVAQVLNAFNLLDQLDEAHRVRLLESIAAVLESFDP